MLILEIEGHICLEGIQSGFLAKLVEGRRRRRQDRELNSTGKGQRERWLKFCNREK
jgi:hypothetical protein